VVIFYYLDDPVASLFKDMRDRFLSGRLYRFAFSGTVVIIFSLDGYIASLFQDMRDRFLSGRLYRFAFSGTVVIFFSPDGSAASLFKIWVTFRQKSRLLTLSDHAARKSGNARRKPGTGFSDAISGALGRPAAQSSESEKSCINNIFHS